MMTEPVVEIINRKAAAETLRILADRIENDDTIRLTVIEHQAWRHNGEQWLSLKWQPR